MWDCGELDELVDVDDYVDEVDLRWKSEWMKWSLRWKGWDKVDAYVDLVEYEVEDWK